MKQLLPLALLTVFVAACGQSNEPSTFGPPAGATQWAVAYRAATAFTCPATTPDSGSATMTADPTGTLLTLTDLGTSLSASGPTSIIFTRDSTGQYLWTDPTGFATISFKFTTSTHAEGEAKRLASPGLPCTATWPFLLDRQ